MDTISAFVNAFHFGFHHNELLPTKQSPTVLVPPHVPINPKIYAAFLDVRVPLTIASVYAVTVHWCNARATGQPYAIAKTRLFKLFVILHNLFLAVYSAWTFVGMVRGVHASIDRSNVLGSFCKIREGTRDALAGETVDGAVLGRTDGGLWEEALAYYGWWFYLSKFYEVVDTAIIIAKGRKSMLLQTYHHTGAMICMWAGIRYMAPPIWIFCVFNSLIHTLMYTYYTLSAAKIKVPVVLKRSLTTLQITQFLVGGSTAVIHLFINIELRGSSTETIPCLSNEAEVFAVITNCIYLAPLTYLFVKFFINSYGKKARNAITTATNIVEKQGQNVKLTHSLTNANGWRQREGADE